MTDKNSVIFSHNSVNFEVDIRLPLLGSTPFTNISSLFTLNENPFNRKV